MINHFIKKSCFLRKGIVLVFFFFFIQNIQSQGVRFGILVEPQFAWLSPDVKNISSDGARIGFNVGLLIDKYFAKNYAFETGVSINNTGGRLLFSTADELTTASAVEIIAANTIVKYKFQYVNVPLGLKLKTNPLGYITFCSNVGLTSQFNIKAKAESEENLILDENISEEIRLFNLGYHIGAGIEYSIGGNSALAANVIYTNGFIDITKSETDKIVLSNIALQIALLF